jgi:lipopolysaccharide heptosyltransferase I
MRITPEKPERILIIKPSSLGDVITAIPVLRGLRRKFPDAHISWLVSNRYADILEPEKDLDDVILFERRKLGRWHRSPLATAALIAFRKRLRTGAYDWVIDLQGLLRSGIFCKWTKAPLRAGFADAREGAPSFYTHRIETEAEHVIDRNVQLAQHMGIDARSEDMTLTLSPGAEESVDALCAEHGLGPGRFTACSIPTRWTTKTYPVRHWRRLVRRLSETEPVALLGGPAENEKRMCAQVAGAENNRVVNLAGKTTLQQLAVLTARARAVICGDSAAKFIAAAVNTPCVTLIGPTRAEYTGPVGQATVIEAQIPCSGCLKKRCPHITCMQSISPDTVWETAVDSKGTEAGQCLS